MMSIDVIRVYSSFDEFPVELASELIDKRELCLYSFSNTHPAIFDQTVFCVLPKNHKGKHKVVYGHDGGEETKYVSQHFTSKVKP